MHLALGGNKRENLDLKEFLSEAQQAAQMTHTHPVPDVEETLLIGQIEHQQKTHGVSEESCRETAKPENRQKTFVTQYKYVAVSH